MYFLTFYVEYTEVYLIPPKLIIHKLGSHSIFLFQ